MPATARIFDSRIARVGGPKYLCGLALMMIWLGIQRIFAPRLGKDFP
jgi:hypothetical protein